ncbi:LysE family translocator [Eionea flava]
MLLSHWLTFLVLTLLATASPGPNSILALSNGLYYGHKRALLTVAGSLLGLSILLAATLFGLHTLLQTYPFLLPIITTVGISYLIFLGISKYVSTHTKKENENRFAPKQHLSNVALFNEGFLVAISNPKILLFFSVFFTPFISPHDSKALQIAILSGTFFVCEALWQIIYSGCGNQLNRFFQHPVHYVRFNKITGIFFIGSACFITYTLIAEEFLR